MAASLLGVVSDHGREAIVDGRYRAGFALSEVALSAELGVSRTPVREAFKQLESEGLIRIVPRVGTFVAAPTRRDLVELHELREVFAGLAAGLFARRGSVPELVALQDNVTASTTALRRGDHATCLDLERAFYDLIVEGSDSRKLALTYRWHQNQLARDRAAEHLLANPERITTAVAAQRRIAERINAKDAYGAEFEMRAHVRATLQVLMEQLASEA